MEEVSHQVTVEPSDHALMMIMTKHAHIGEAIHGVISKSLWNRHSNTQHRDSADVSTAGQDAGHRSKR